MWRQIPRLWLEITDKAGPIVLSSNVAWGNCREIWTIEGSRNRFKAPKTEQQAAAQPPCPTFWSMRCASIARRNLSCGWRLGTRASCKARICCLPTSTELPLHPYHFGTLAGPPGQRRYRRSPGLTFHALRHTHASQLIDQGDVDIVTISKRLGHAHAGPSRCAPTRTLFRKDDGKAAAAINAALQNGSGINAGRAPVAIRWQRPRCLFSLAAFSK